MNTDTGIQLSKLLEGWRSLTAETEEPYSRKMNAVNNGITILEDLIDRDCGKAPVMRVSRV